MSHVRAVLIASAISTASLLTYAAPAPLRWRLRLLVWTGGLVLGLFT